jgi:serine/threonine protein phosphatase PrpC
MASENANAQPQPPRLIFAKGTDVGRKRGHNEDYVAAFRPSDPEKHRQKGELFIVADGMGGHQAGEVASEKAVEAVSHEYYASPASDVRGALVSAIQEANSLIYRMAQESSSRAGMGTTVVAAAVRGQGLHLANVGDSRAYLLRDGRLAQVTRDHSFVQDQIEAGILTPEEARTHPQRNVVTRALGSKPDVKVDTFGGKLQPGDTLLLCSDGLSEHVQDEDMAAMLRQYPPKEAVPRLIALANSRGGSDNITALVLQVGSPPGTAAAAAAPPEQAAATAPSRTAEARQGLSVPLIAGLGAGGLILVAALLVGGLFLFRPELIPGRETATPTATPTSPPTSTTMATVTAVPQPTSTPRPTNGGAVLEPTSTPRVGLSLIEPEDERMITPEERVTFRWEVPGTLPVPFKFLVKTDQSGDGALCEGIQMSCRSSLPAGDYQWWVELWSGNDMVAESERRMLRVHPPTATHTPTPTFTPPPPTNTPIPFGGGDGGDDDGSGGGTEPPPTAKPIETLSIPTLETPTTPPPTEKPTAPPPSGNAGG